MSDRIILDLNGERKVLTRQELIDNFSDVVDIGAGIIRCQDQTPRSIFYYYVKPATPGSLKADLLLVSENRADDEFAQLILDGVSDQSSISGLNSLTLPCNKYGFQVVLLAPPHYHAYFKGVLDERRGCLVLCLPAYDCEFSGNESADEFVLMRREVVPTLDWDRSVCPKIILRFDNPKTSSGTGEKEVVARYELVLREIDNLNGVPKGYIEISNYRGQVIEILSPEAGSFVIVRDRNDEHRQILSKDSLLEALWVFLIGDSPSFDEIH